VADAFGMIERDAVDMAIMRCLCANGIPFNVLRSPQWSEMVAAINKGPKGYKSPSSEKARTSLLDACKRNVEQDLGALKNTWHTHGVSIVSDGWTNMKNKPLINVIASNSRGSMFLYADDFSGIEKTGEAIADYLLKAIEDIGASMVMQVVTDNASNCKAAGREIEKVRICHLLLFISLLLLLLVIQIQSFRVLFRHSVFINLKHYFSLGAQTHFLVTLRSAYSESDI